MKQLLVSSILSVMLFQTVDARAGDFMDTRISFTVSDDNIFQGPTNTNPPSPSIPNFIGSSNNTQFYDNYDTRFTGFETLTNLAIFKRMPGFFKGLDTEAGLVLNALVRDDASVRIGDAGSFLRLIVPFGENKERNNINLVAFPVSSDRFRNGFSYAISWGGNPVFQGTGLVPGFKLTLVQPNWYAYLGAKTGLRQRIQIDGTREMDTVYGLLAGFGIDFTETLSFEANGGYFDRGSIDKREVQTQSLQGFGGSAQLAYHRGLPIGTSIDFQLYRNDPDMPLKFFTPEIYDDGFSFLFKTEFTVMGQNLQRVDAPRSTTIQLAMAGDINISAKYRKARFFLDAVYRSLAFILYNVPSNPSFNAFPPGTEANPEFFVAGGMDYFIAVAHLTPGFKLGVQRPASYRGTANAGNNAPDSLAGAQTFVFRDSVNVDVLDAGLAVEPIFAVTGSVRWDLSEIMSAALQVLGRYDTNRTTFRQDPDGITVTRTLLPPWSLGFNLLLQSRF